MRINGRWVVVALSPENLSEWKQMLHVKPLVEIDLDVGRLSAKPRLDTSKQYRRKSDGVKLGCFVRDESNADHTIMVFEDGKIKTPHWDDPSSYDAAEFVVIERE
jgi:hypothetical protein